MKKIFRIFIILFMVAAYSCSVSRPVQYGSGQQNRDDGYHATYQVFYDHLNPYGQWVDYPQYGYIWIPDAGSNFFPYVSDGRWIFTDFGWTWLSDYDWGWAPFHYGRWDYDNYYGWFWVPGEEWGPAWVIWRRANGYYGWAPMRPGLNVRSAMLGGTRDVERWSFISERDFGRDDIHRRYINRRNNEQIFMNSTIINNTYIDNRRNVTYISGPLPEDVRRVTGRKVNPVIINDLDRPGRRVTSSSLEIYRPQVDSEIDRRATPLRVTDPGDLKPAADRKAVNNRRSSDRSMGTRQSEDLEQETKVQRQVDQQRTDPGTRRTEKTDEGNSGRRRR